MAFLKKGFLKRRFILEIDKLSFFCSTSAQSTSQVTGPRGNSYQVYEQSSILSAFICVDWLWVKSSVYSFLQFIIPACSYGTFTLFRHRESCQEPRATQGLWLKQTWPVEDASLDPPPPLLRWQGPGGLARWRCWSPRLWVSREVTP